MAEAAENGEHRVEVFAVFTMFGDFDEMFDDFHALDGVVLGANLGTHPKHFPVHCESEDGKQTDMNTDLKTN